ncbi:MAG: EAL domain-containing protein [Mycobacteriales bacterium]
MRASDEVVSHRLLSDAEIERICVDNLLSQVPEQIYFKDLFSRFLRVSKGQADIFGAAGPDEVIGKSDFDFFSAKHAQAAYDAEQEIIRTGIPQLLVEETQTWPDRPDDYILTSKYPLRDADGTIIGTFGVSQDITRRVTAEAAARAHSDELSLANHELRRVEHELRALLQGSPDAVVKLDRDLRHLYVNPKAAELVGLPAEAIIGRTNREIGRPAGGLDLWEASLRAVLETGVTAEHESSHDLEGGTLFMHSRLAPIFAVDGSVTGVLVASRDLTDRKLAEEALAHQAVHDPVTGLANRTLLLDRVGHAITRLERNPGTVSVLFMDLDRFKVVNDSLGHAAGDQVLQEVARRLLRTARRGDTVARFGGDEFVVLCEGLPNDELIRVLAVRIGVALAAPFVVDGHEVSMSASIGIATAGDWRRSAEDMIRDADAAMYLAKERGRGRFEFFDASVRERANARLDIEAGLRRALERGEFHLVYQPLISLADRSVTGLEALIRWEHPEYGALSPADFIPVAEETRLIVPIDRWVLDEACRQLVAWNAERPAGPPLTMAVNISGRQLSEPDVVEAVVAVLDRHKLTPGLLCLEVTETAMLQDVIPAQRVFEKLAAIGVQLALDDFGTGYSSLGHLQRFPVNILKIDRSFVERMHAGNDESAIVAAVTAMARALGMRTVGEGIETDEQLEGLTGLGCNDGQGYLLARPARPDQLRTTLGLDVAH